MCLILKRYVYTVVIVYSFASLYLISENNYNKIHKTLVKMGKQLENVELPIRFDKKSSKNGYFH